MHLSIKNDPTGGYINLSHHMLSQQAKQTRSVLSSSKTEEKRPSKHSNTMGGETEGEYPTSFSRDNSALLATMTEQLKKLNLISGVLAEIGG